MTGAEPEPAQPTDRASFGSRLYRQMLRVLGPAQITPYGEARTEPVADTTCSLCGRPESEHTVDRSAGASRLRCPRPADVTTS